MQCWRDAGWWNCQDKAVKLNTKRQTYKTIKKDYHSWALRGRSSIFKKNMLFTEWINIKIKETINKLKVLKVITINWRT